MKFHHFASARQVHGFMRGQVVGPFSTFCPTSNLMSHGVLTLHCLYERPLIFRLSQDSPYDTSICNTSVCDTSVFDPAYVKLMFEEGCRNRFTLKLLTRREERQFVKTQRVPNGAALVVWVPKDWGRKQNRPLVGATFTLAIDGLVTVFQNNLRQVIDARWPHNAELYPNASCKLAPAQNIYAYAHPYLQGYQGRMRRMKDPTIVNLMDRNALAEVNREEQILLILEDITRKLGELVGSYQQGQVPKSLEEAIVGQVLMLPKGKLKGSYL